MIPLPTYTNAFDLAIYVTMWNEVGHHWETEPQYSPSDPEIQAGLCDTVQQRKKTGFIEYPGFPFATKKLGIVRSIHSDAGDPRGLTYAECINLHNQHLWVSHGIGTFDRPLSIMAFDAAVLWGAEIALKQVSLAVQATSLGISGQSSAHQVELCLALSNALHTFISTTCSSDNASRKELGPVWRARVDAVTSFAVQYVT
jgi:hypothetical protein